MTNDRPTVSEGAARWPWSELQELPWWAGVLLTAADMLDQPWLSTAIWLGVITRVCWRVVRRRADRARPPRPARDKLPKPG